ncbi:hypothetical protein Tco_0618466 [Tanacetum coccineum]
MNPIASQQASLDNSLVAPEKRLKIERCNSRIAFTKPQKEETYQVTLDALKLSLCHPVFQITAEVPEIYMHQFWNTIKKIRKKDAYDFKLDKKKCRIETEVHLWKSTRLDRLRESQAQVLWAMYNQKNVDYVALLWEDFMYQADNREISSARKEHMPYPRFTKVIIDHFISKDNTISMRNRINLHTARDDSLLVSLKFVTKTEDCQKCGALIPDGMINDDIKLSTAYKTYLDYATGKVPPNKARKFKKPAYPKLKTILASPKEPTQKGKRVKRPAKKGYYCPKTSVVIRHTPDKSVLKKIAPAKSNRGKGIELLSNATLLEDAQLKKTLRKSKQETHKLQASGSSGGANFKSEVSDEQNGKTRVTSEGTSVKPGVPDVTKEYSSDSDVDSWGNSEDENDDFNDEDDDGGNDDDDGNDDDGGNNDDSDNNDDGGNDVQDSDQTNSDDNENPSFTLKDYKEEEQDEEYVYTPKKDKSDDEEKMYQEDDDDVAKELYGDFNAETRWRKD